MRISVFLPSCSRIDALLGCIESLYETKGEHDVELVLVVDDYAQEDIIRSIIRVEGSYILDFSAERRGALRCWNRGLELSTGDILVPAGDDQIFYPGWLDYALESHKDKLNGYGVVGMNDLAYDGNTQVATMFLFDRQWCIDNMGGIFAPPVLNYYCVDLWWNEKAKALGNFYWDSRAVVEHVHSAHGKRPVDFLDQEKVDNDWAAIDTATYEKYKADGFPVDWGGAV